MTKANKVYERLFPKLCVKTIILYTTRLNTLLQYVNVILVSDSYAGTYYLAIPNCMYYTVVY